MATAEYTTRLDKEAVLLTTTTLQAVIVPEFGANLIELKHLGYGVNVLRTPATMEDYLYNPYLCGIPVLFPPNRILDGVFTYDGRKYELPITEPLRHNHLHGFVHDQKWRVTDLSADADTAYVELTIRSEDVQGLAEYFPHSFALTLRYLITDEGLTQELTVFNRGNDSMPCGVGFHTTFQLPFGGSLEDCKLSLTADDAWELNDRLVPTGHLKDVSDWHWEEGVKLPGLALDNAYVATHVSDAKGFCQVARVLDESSGIFVEYRCFDGYRHWVVFTDDGHQSFVSVEPYSWVTNAPNLDLPADLTGFLALPAGESKRYRSEICISKRK